MNIKTKTIMKHKIVCISMQPDQHQKLKQLATINGISLSEMLVNNTLKNKDNENY